MEELTKRQQEILRMIREFIADSGFRRRARTSAARWAFTRRNAAEEHLPRTLPAKAPSKCWRALRAASA
jgi:SOS-response transcriptional repressor LexA